MVDGPFAQIFSVDSVYRLRGLLSALIVLVPERTGRELGEFMPKLQASPGFAEAFLEALPWREEKYILPQAVAFVEELLARGHSSSARRADADAVMDRVLLLAAQPDHPLNARWLHSRLLPLAMPDRDLSWSTYLHRSRAAQSWQTPGIIERLLDWGWPENADDADPCAGFEDEVATLAAITLAWCLTTSNRYIRDRATKALVCVLRNRLQLVPLLLADFESVDDLYVIERLLCAVYGTVMRSESREQVGAVALAVYRHVFENGRPPAHVLLRDYAREIVEYAIHIGCSLDVDISRIRPPYQSDPIPSGIPTWEELKTRYDAAEFSGLLFSLAPNWGDFARYVLGTDSHGHGLHTWTDQPDPFEEYRRLDTERLTLPEPLATRWYQAHHGDTLSRLADTYHLQQDTDLEKSHLVSKDGEDGACEPQELASLFKQHAEQIAAFRASLSLEESEVIERYEAITEARSAAYEAACETQQSQGMESDFACRWIIMRVMEMGWTPDRFAAFDREMNWRDTRAAQKAERIGKKYQWLAYHELAARVFDHRPLHHDSMSGSEWYEGPWQMHLRDIDPSFLIKRVPDQIEKRCWWNPLDDPLLQGDRLTDHAWLTDHNSIPDFIPLLSLKRPSDSSLWYPLETFGEWIAGEQEEDKNGRTYQRRLTFSLGAWLLPRATMNSFVDSISLLEWTGMDVTSIDYYEPFLGEFAWAPSFGRYSADARAELNDPTDPNNNQIRHFDGVPFAAARTVMRYLHEGRSFDCSLTEACSGSTPSTWLAQRMQLSWGRRMFTFIDPNNEILAYDPSYETPGPRAFVFKQEALQKFLNASGLALVWLLIGEKLLIGDEANRDKEHPRVSVFRHIFSLSRDHTPELASRTLGYLGQRPTTY
ncbi:MAG: hypothetical protein K8T91_01330 [Planctomycetes bacterium]|nr:hypothetical protein [Planctomycetota bacterium]